MERDRFLPDELRAIRAALLGPAGDDLIRLMFDLNVRRRAAPARPEALGQAAALGWIEAGPGGRQQPTAAGQRVADSLREYVLWLERGRQLSAGEDQPALRAKQFTGQRVLELGCGFGCNLLSMAPHAARTVGVDLVPTYLQMSRILADREGIPQLDLVLAPAESLPFAPERFDTVLIRAAFQCLDPISVLPEAARVLTPGGKLLIVTSSFGQLLRRLIATPGQWLRRDHLRFELLTVLNSVSLQVRGQPAWVRPGRSRNEYAVYLSRGWMRRRLREAGFRLVEPPVTVGGRYDTLYHAERTPGRPRPALAAS